MAGLGAQPCGIRVPLTPCQQPLRRHPLDSALMCAISLQPGPRKHHPSVVSGAMPYSPQQNGCLGTAASHPALSPVPVSDGCVRMANSAVHPFIVPWAVGLSEHLPARLGPRQMRALTAKLASSPATPRISAVTSLKPFVIFLLFTNTFTFLLAPSQLLFPLFHQMCQQRRGS